MNILTVENIGKSFGERVLFTDISFGISKGQKIAFIARNGVGKTTLLRIIAGEESPDEGQVITRRGLNIGYLAQDDKLDDEMSIEQVILSTDNPVLKVVQEYEESLLHPEDKAAYQKAYDAMERIGGWDFELRYKQILTRLQLPDLKQKVGTLSGGQRKRLSLAVTLLGNPDLLILDEPTNHLDMTMIEWLEQYLKDAKLSLFMVTHDRYFLERVCDEIIELDQGKIYKYTGNYSYFLDKKQQRLDIEKASVEKAKNLYRKELQWIRRTPMARTSKAKYRIQAFDAIKEQAHRKTDEERMNLEINMQRLGSKVLELHHVQKQYGGRKLISSFSYVFKRGERVGIIGDNGSGKTTLLNIIAKKINPDQGKVVHGETLRIGYYSQRGMSYKSGQKVIDVIREFGEYIPLTKGKKITAAQLLERFLFDRKQQYDYVEKLSGGEKKRLFLCTVLIQNPNFLILDEPTNDLDIITLNVLEEFLNEYPGTLLVVSHDRYFMDKTVDHLFVLKGAEIKDFPGNYSDYKESLAQRKNEKKNTPEKKTATKEKTVSLSYKEKQELQSLEKEIKDLEHKKKLLEDGFAQGQIPEDKIYIAGEHLKVIIRELEEKEMRWLELSMKGGE